MIQEYLLLDEAEKNSIESYKPEKIDVKIFSVNNDVCFYIQYNADGNNEKTARKLSKVDEYVRDKFKVAVLKSGCSSYFNNRLYPLISSFEYSLRNLLYLNSSINKDEKYASTIKNIESLDFGEIFTFLFIDDDFMKKTKNYTKNLNQKDFLKSDVLAYIESLEENTLWDTMLEKDTVPTLKNNFNLVRDYRNKVMHSHNISWDEYKNIQKMFRKINSEIEIALHNIEATENITQSKTTFNKKLEDIFSAQERLGKVLDVSQSVNNPFAEFLRATNIPDISTVEKFKGYCQPLSYEARTTIESLTRAATASFETSPLLKELAEIKCEIPPAIKKLQELSNSYKINTIEPPEELFRLQNSLSRFNDFSSKATSAVEE
jgi:hypothetical protein